MGTVEEVLGRLQRQRIETRGATLRDENKVTKWCMHIPLRYIRVLYILLEAATSRAKCHTGCTHKLMVISPHTGNKLK